MYTGVKMSDTQVHGAGGLGDAISGELTMNAYAEGIRAYALT
jgi:hypothetical protein